MINKVFFRFIKKNQSVANTRLPIFQANTGGGNLQERLQDCDMGRIQAFDELECRSRVLTAHTNQLRADYGQDTRLSEGKLKQVLAVEHDRRCGDMNTCYMGLNVSRQGTIPVQCYGGAIDNSFQSNCSSSQATGVCHAIGDPSG